MTLKLSGKSDDVLVRLLTELGLADQLPADPKRNASCTATQCALVPYDDKGMRLPEGSKQPKMWLDLSPGASIRLLSEGPAEHNHQGAKQPSTIHIGSKSGQKFGGKPIAGAGSHPGVGKVVRREEDTCSLVLQVEVPNQGPQTLYHVPCTLLPAPCTHARASNPATGCLLRRQQCCLRSSLPALAAPAGSTR